MLRRNLFRATAGLLAAPALVRIDSIMPVRLWRPPSEFWFEGVHLTNLGHQELARVLLEFGPYLRDDYPFPIG